MSKQTSDDRRARCRLKTLYKKGKLKKGDTLTTYVDNAGGEHDYKWAARCASFLNVFRGCLRNGFPVVVPRLWYSAWACYPFFFIRKTLNVSDPIPTLNHERIHIRQQRDIHLVVSVPLIIVAFILELLTDFNPLWILCWVPFIPTFFYAVEMLRSWNQLQKNVDNCDTPITLNNVRENTCFEREAISRSTNAEYLFKRKFWAVLAYTGIKCFQNYGMK